MTRRRDRPNPGSGSRVVAAMLAAATLLAAASGCDRRPTGPGTLHATVEAVGQPLGGAVLVLSGEGIVGIASDGASEVWSRLVDEESGSHRVVVISLDGSAPLRLEVAVQDVSAPFPQASILELTDTTNQRVHVVETHRVHFGR